MEQRGAAGVAGIVAVVAVIIAVGGYLILNNKYQAHPTLSNYATDATETATSTQDSATSSTALIYLGLPVDDPSSLFALIPVDSRMSKNTGGLYLKKSAAFSGDPQAQAQYLKFDVPDPKTVVRIYPSVTWKNPAQGASVVQKSSTANDAAPIAYYKDQTNVYVLQEQSAGDVSGTSDSLAVLAGADPATFQLLGDQYARDADHVYVITTTCFEGACTQSLIVIPEADLPTFQAFEESLIEQPSGSAIIVDAADINNLYYGGAVVGQASEELLATKKIYGTPEPNGLIWVAP
ncbi:MAG: hypothetical protein RLZZ416_379 [Candidatus Parcubacteria bacterium]|jgi:hypothetical protein